MQTENITRKTEHVSVEAFKEDIDYFLSLNEANIVIERNGRPLAVLTPYHHPLAADEEEALFARFKAARQRILDQSGMTVAQFEAIFDPAAFDLCS